MKFYGIDSEGVFKVPTVATLPIYDYTKHKGTIYYQTADNSIYTGIGDADGYWVRNGVESLPTLPTWTATDEGKLVYVEDVGKMYYGGSSYWSSIDKTIGENRTIYLATTGSDTTGDGTEAAPWYSIAKAFAYLNDKSISTDVLVTIQLADGNYNYSETQICNHPDGARIQITGEHSYEKAMTEIITGCTVTTASSGVEVTAVIELNNVTNIAINDYVLIRNCFENVDVGDLASAGDIRNATETPDYDERGEPIQINGCFKVTNVSSSTSRITVSATYRPAYTKEPITITPNVYEADVTVIKSILTFTDCTGIWVNSSNDLGSQTNVGIDKLLIKTTTDYTNDANCYYEMGSGIFSSENSYISIGESVGLIDWWVGLGIHTGSVIYSPRITVTGCTKFGISTAAGSTVNCSLAHISGCNQAGICENGSSVCYSFSSVVVCCQFGAWAFNSSCSHTAAIACCNCLHGVRSEQLAELHCHNCAIHKCTYALYTTEMGTIITGNGDIFNCTVGAGASHLSYIGLSNSTTFTTCGTTSSPVANAGLNSTGGSITGTPIVVA